MDKKKHIIFFKIIALVLFISIGIGGFVLSCINNPEKWLSYLTIIGTGTNVPYASLVSTKQTLEQQNNSSMTYSSQGEKANDNDLSVYNPEHGYVIEQIEQLKPTEEMVDNNSSFFADTETADALIPIGQRKPSLELSLNVTQESEHYLKYGDGITLNNTSIENDQAKQQLEQAPSFTIELNSNEPQVLIFHTHTTESFDRFDAEYYDINYPSRSTDSKNNIVKIGETITNVLNSNGINTVHATEYHDYPTFEGAYYRSADTVTKYLELYPSIKVVLDVHRDGLEREDGTRLKPLVTIDGKKIAQIMLVCNADDGTGYHPDFYENFRLAARIQSDMETLFPGITRPILFDYRDYNQFMHPGMLLVEVGSHGNSLEQAVLSAACFGTALSQTLLKLS